MRWFDFFFNGYVHVFSHWYFLKKDEIVALTLMCKNVHMQKVTWICHGISPWMRDCIIDCSHQNSVALTQFIQFFATFWLTYFDLFHKITTKHATNRGEEQQILQSIVMILASVSFCFTIPWFTTRKQAWFQCFNAPQWFHLRHHTVARTKNNGFKSFLEENS